MQAPAHTTPTPPMQPTLPGLAPPSPGRAHAALLAALDAGHPLRISAMGRVLRDATVRQCDSGAVLLEVLLQQDVAHHPHATALLAAMHAPDCGSTAATLDWARHRAAGLRAGTTALVVGRGLQPGTHTGTPVLRLLHTLQVLRADSLPQAPTTGD